MTGHRDLEKKQITQGNNRKVQNPGGSPNGSLHTKASFFMPKFYFLYKNNCPKKDSY